jgi:hypothetical protein
MVDFGFGQGLSFSATTGIVRLFRGLQESENAALGQKMPFMDRHYLYVSVAKIICLSVSLQNVACLDMIWNFSADFKSCPSLNSILWARPAFLLI